MIYIYISGWENADPIVAMLIATLIMATILPIAIYNGKILLQTLPSNIMVQLDKSLREVCFYLTN